MLPPWGTQRGRSQHTLALHRKTKLPARMQNWHQRLANTTYTPAVWVAILLFQARQPPANPSLTQN